MNITPTLVSHLFCGTFSSSQWVLGPWPSLWARKGGLFELNLACNKTLTSLFKTNLRTCAQSNMSFLLLPTKTVVWWSLSSRTPQPKKKTWHLNYLNQSSQSVKKHGGNPPGPPGQSLPVSRPACCHTSSGSVAETPCFDSWHLQLGRLSLYPPVNVYIATGEDPFFMGKFT